jgi:ferredoxin
MSTRLGVNPIACDGHGLCAELFPERIVLDDWGYPIVDHSPIPRTLEQHARRAVDACPVLALRLEQLNHRERGRSARVPGRRTRLNQGSE